MTVITSAIRVFKMGSVELADPDPSQTPKQVLALYSNNYPQLKNATLPEPELVAGRLVYSIELPPVKTKG